MGNLDLFVSMPEEIKYALEDIAQSRTRQSREKKVTLKMVVIEALEQYIAAHQGTSNTEQPKE